MLEKTREKIHEVFEILGDAELTERGHQEERHFEQQERKPLHPGIPKERLEIDKSKQRP